MKKRLGIVLALVALTGALASCGGNHVTSRAYYQSGNDNYIYVADVSAYGGIVTSVKYDAVQKLPGLVQLSKAVADTGDIPYVVASNENTGDTFYFAKSVVLPGGIVNGEQKWYTYEASVSESYSYQSSGEYVDYTPTDVSGQTGANSIHVYLGQAVNYPERGDWYLNIVENGNYYVLDKDNNRIKSDDARLMVNNGSVNKNDERYSGEDKATFKTNCEALSNWFVTKWNKVYPTTGDGKKARFTYKNKVNAVHLEWDEIVATEDGGTRRETQKSDDVTADGITFTNLEFQDLYQVTWSGFRTIELNSYSFL